MVSFDRTVYNRETYDLLKFMGDLGGLNDALQAIGYLLVGWYSSFNAGSFMLSKLYVQSTQIFQKKRSLGLSFDNENGNSTGKKNFLKSRIEEDF